MPHIRLKSSSKPQNEDSGLDWIILPTFLLIGIVCIVVILYLFPDTLPFSHNDWTKNDGDNIINQDGVQWKLSGDVNQDLIISWPSEASIKYVNLSWISLQQSPIDDQGTLIASNIVPDPTKDIQSYTISNYAHPQTLPSSEPVIFKIQALNSKGWTSFIYLTTVMQRMSSVTNITLSSTSQSASFTLPMTLSWDQMDISIKNYKAWMLYNGNWILLNPTTPARIDLSTNRMFVKVTDQHIPVSGIGGKIRFLVYAIDPKGLAGYATETQDFEYAF